MAPKKDNKKVMANDIAAPATPKKGKVVAAAEPSPKKGTPKKPKATTAAFKPTSEEGVIQVSVSTEDENGMAIQTKSGSFHQLVRLSAATSFTISKTIMITEGDHVGQQAILIIPAKPFDFLKLPEQARNIVYREYFACRGVRNSDIVLDGKRSRNKEVFAKTYANGSQHRVALLAISKEVNAQASPIFYSHTLKFDSTSTLLDFLCQVPGSVRPRLNSILIKSYNKATARNAMHFLAEAANLRRLTFESGVFTEGDPAKAAKTFHGESYKFLEAIGAAKGDKVAALDVLVFGKGALTAKDEKKNIKNWDDDKVEEFRQLLKAKLL